MIDDDLPPDLRALLDAEKRSDDAPPPGAKARVSHALSVSLGIGIGAAAAGSAGATAAGAAAATTAAGAGITATSGALAKGLAFALVAALTGTAGTGIYLAKNKDRERVVAVAQQRDEPSTVPPSLHTTVEPPPLDSPTAPVSVENVPIASTRAAPIPSAARAAPVVSTPSRARHTVERLREERALLDTARDAVSRDDGAAALRALEGHRRRYADGELVEERDALTVLALAKLGRIDNAKNAAAALRARHPRSLFRPAIDAALREPYHGAGSD